MGPHSSWFDFLPGLETLKHNLQFYFGRDWTWQVFRSTHFEVSHMLFGAVVVLFAFLGALRYAISLRGAGDAALLPAPKFGLRAFFEGMAEVVYGLVEGIMGPKDTAKYLPFIGSVFIFVLFSNLLALIPGCLPPTDTLKTNVALAGLVLP